MIESGKPSLSIFYQKDISQNPHHKITLLYFEILNRYWTYFDFQQHYLPKVMESFIDRRFHSNYFSLLNFHSGVHNSSLHIRNRVYSLFQRFSKVMKLKLHGLVDPVLKGCQVKHSLLLSQI